jgi:hypothetical protein
MRVLPLDNKLLSCWWKILLHMDDAVILGDKMPFAGMELCLEHFRLPLPAVPQFEMVKPTGKDLPEPSFENLTIFILTDLRKSIYLRLNRTLTSAWAEKLLRFCEIRLSSLETRARRKWGDIQNARLNFLQVAAFLLDYGMQTRDLRYLNTVLKLCDQKWVINPRSIKGGLRKGGENAIAALFQIRILLLSGYALDMLQEANS